MAKANSTPAAGVQLGRYRVESELGRGGMGVVYACMDESLGRRVAVKTLSVGLLGRDREARMHRFQREVKALSQLDHPGILHIYDAGEADDPVVGWVLYYAMEVIEGETLSERLIRGGAMELGQACAVVAKCAEALGSAHERGIVHRDVKPANIFIATRGRVVVADFGVCKIEGGQEITRKDQMVGTPSYLAPEQILGLPVDARTDVFALGALLYVLISNTALRPQLDRAGLSKLAATDDAAMRAAGLKNVPAGMPQTIARALARDPKDRFPNGAALAEALEPFCGRVPEPFETSQANPRGAFKVPLAALTSSAFTDATNRSGMGPAGMALGLDVAAEVIGGDTAVDAHPAGELAPLGPSPTTDPPAPVDAVTDEEDDPNAPDEDEADGFATVRSVEPFGAGEEAGGGAPPDAGPPVDEDTDTAGPPTSPRLRLPGGLAIPARLALAAGAFVLTFVAVLVVGLNRADNPHSAPQAVAPPLPEPAAAAVPAPAPESPERPAACRAPSRSPNLREMESLIEKAGALEKKGDHKHALPVWEKVAGMDPEGWQGHFGYGRALKRHGQPDRAKEHFQCVVTLRPGTAEAELATAELKVLGGK